MARKLRVQFEGAIYHVTIRGVDRRVIYREEIDRARFLKRMGEAAEEYGVRLYLFCLMENHAHLLVETPQANLSAFMHKLQTAYTVYFNRRHGRSGHLMQGRFGAKPVQGDDYLLRLVRYLHLNPVFVKGMRDRPLEERRACLEAYRWSSHRAYAGLEGMPEWIAAAPILALMGGLPLRKQHAAYRRFVETGLVEADEEFLETLKHAAWGIGDELFQERLRDLHTDQALRVRHIEDVAFRRLGCRVPPETVLATVATAFGVAPARLRQRSYGCPARAVAARMLGVYVGMNQRGIAVYLGAGTGAAVSAQLKQLRVRLDQDVKLAAAFQEAQQALDGIVARERKGMLAPLTNT